MYWALGIYTMCVCVCVCVCVSVCVSVRVFVCVCGYLNIILIYRQVLSVYGILHREKCTSFLTHSINTQSTRTIICTNLNGVNLKTNPEGLAWVRNPKPGEFLDKARVNLE